MKKFLVFLTITMFLFYILVAFISFLPNPATWDVGGRAAFAIFSILIAITAYMIHENQ